MGSLDEFPVWRRRREQVGVQECVELLLDRTLDRKHGDILRCRWRVGVERLAHVGLITSRIEFLLAASIASANSERSHSRSTVKPRSSAAIIAASAHLSTSVPTSRWNSAPLS